MSKYSEMKNQDHANNSSDKNISFDSDGDGDIASVSVGMKQDGSKRAGDNKLKRTIFNEVPLFYVDISKKPEERWNEIIDVYKNQMNDMMKEIDGYLSMLGIGGSVLLKLISIFRQRVYFIKELEAISARSKFPLDKLILLQLCYEVFACCTSIIINNGDETVTIRTMDWDMKELTKLTIRILFMNGKKPLFMATSWAGYVGVMTAVKPDICTVALNFRTTGSSILSNLKESLTGSWPIGFLIRHLLETKNTYDEIRGCLAGTELIAPCYISMSGPKKGQGHIICRQRTSADKVQLLGPDDGDYLCQTNLDNDLEHDKKSGEGILYSKRRLKMVREIMKKYTTVNDIKDLVGMFDCWPIINEETVYVTVMRAKNKNESQNKGQNKGQNKTKYETTQDFKHETKQKSMNSTDTDDNTDTDHLSTESYLWSKDLENLEHCDSVSHTHDNFATMKTWTIG
jgi:hypothetical protein